MPTESELVSIVVVSYNNWPDLELAVQSALCQSHREIEVIVVDNSSTDATSEELPRRFGDRIRFLRQANRRDSGAYNAGLRLARGNFVHFLDGDDLLAPNAIEKQLAIFRTAPETDIVYGSVSCFKTHPGFADWKDSQWGDRQITLETYIGHGGIGVEAALSFLFRRSALERIGEWDESLYVADVDYVLRALWTGCRFSYCPGAPLAFYRVRLGQMSSNTSAMLAGSELVWEKALSYVDREPYARMVKAELARLRFLGALTRNDLSLVQRLVKCGEARSTSSSQISLPAYAVGLLTIVLPGGRFLALSPRFRSFRRFAARLAGFRQV